MVANNTYFSCNTTIAPMVGREGILDWVAVVVDPQHAIYACRGYSCGCFVRSNNFLGEINQLVQDACQHVGGRRSGWQRVEHNGKRCHFAEERGGKRMPVRLLPLLGGLLGVTFGGCFPPDSGTISTSFR